MAKIGEKVLLKHIYSQTNLSKCSVRDERQVLRVCNDSDDFKEDDDYIGRRHDKLFARYDVCI